MKPPQTTDSDKYVDDFILLPAFLTQLKAVLGGFPNNFALFDVFFREPFL